MPTILVLHGPNMALKGVAAVDDSLSARASELGVELSVFQSNTEGVLLDHLVALREEIDGIIVNPGVLAPTAWALAEALTLVNKPTVEVLLTAPTRGPSALTGVVAHQVHDQGPRGYVAALEHLMKVLPKAAVEEGEEKEEEEEGRRQPWASVSGKTIGRRPSPEPDEPSARRTEKTIGRKAPPAAAQAAEKTTVKAAGQRAIERPATGLGLTREQVRKKVSARLSGAVTTDALASWARGEWSLLQKGGPCEDGQRELLDSVLLTLMAASRASEHALLAQLARLG